MIAAPIVTVLLGGRPIASITPALLTGGFVSAPLLPYGPLIADRVVVDSQHRVIVFERGAASVTINDPFLRGCAVRFPLGLVARALGEDVRYDGASRTLAIVRVPAPLATMTPYVQWTPPPGPLPTFTPRAVPLPNPTISGIPRPRRTPVVMTNPPQSGP